ncbi:MAG: hypothetical protein BGO49_25295 [Planctomycetales bacterium 71-10]|nr:MAG: hypothetical protein BGO49_25295 [Planctomycetales bacterium 71-10]
MPEAIMAKRKSATPRKPPVTTTAKSVAFRVSADYAEWLERASSFDRSSVSAFLDRAVATYAKTIGFESPPERT